MRGPLGYIDMSAVGGVKPENVEQFLDAGVCGFGVGGQLVLASAVKSGDFAAIQARAKQFTDAIAAWNESIRKPNAGLKTPGRVCAPKAWNFECLLIIPSRSKREVQERNERPLCGIQ